MIIFKQKLNLGRNRITLPKGAKVLTVQVQRNEAVIWYVIWYAFDHETQEMEERVFFGGGTGIMYTEYSIADLNYISTVQDDGGFVWHFFEVKQ